MMALVAVCATALVLVAPAAATGPAGSSVQIERKATFDPTQPGTIILTLDMQCPAGEFTTIVANVSQQQVGGVNANGFAFVSSVPCAGTKQTFGINIGPGPFNAGGAYASAELFTGANIAGDARVIEIG
jgi:hypothetical protein